MICLHIVMRKFIQITLIIISCLQGQDSSSANGSLAETGIFLKDLHFDWKPPHKDNGTFYSIDLHEFKFGFSDLNFFQEQKGDKHKIKTKKRQGMIWPAENYFVHGVAPITRGVRWSVNSFLGMEECVIEQNRNYGSDFWYHKSTKPYNDIVEANAIKFNPELK